MGDSYEQSTPMALPFSLFAYIDTSDEESTTDHSYICTPDQLG